MSETKIVLNASGLREVLRSKWAQGEVSKRAQAIRDACNATTTAGKNGYEWREDKNARKRARASVRTESFYAWGHESQHHTLAEFANAHKH